MFETILPWAIGGLLAVAFGFALKNILTRKQKARPTYRPGGGGGGGGGGDDGRSVQ